MFQTKIERYLSILRNFLCSETFLSPAICNGKRTGEKCSFPLIIQCSRRAPQVSTEGPWDRKKNIISRDPTAMRPKLHYSQYSVSLLQTVSIKSMRPTFWLLRTCGSKTPQKEASLCEDQVCCCFGVYYFNDGDIHGNSVTLHSRMN